MRTGGLFAVVLLASCGGGGTFTPATPPASICALLTLEDLAPIFPDAVGSGEYPIFPDLDLWRGSCNWYAAGSGQTLNLAVYGATTAKGLQQLWPPSLAGAARTPVTGLGAAAQYWEQQGITGLWAIEGGTSVNLSGYYFAPSPTEAQLHPLVAKVLGQLE